MRALFIHDHIFHKKNGKFYSGGSFPLQAWDRYFDTGKVDKLVVVGRGLEVEKNGAGLVLTSNEKTEFDLLYQIQGGLEYYTKKSIIKEHLTKNISEVDYVIIRSSNFGRIGAEICRKLNKPYILEVVACNWDSFWNYGNLGGKLMAPKGYFNLRKLAKHSFATLYVTENFLQNRYPTQGSITTNVSNVEIPEISEETKDNHLEFLKRQSPDKILRIAHLGDVATKFKGFDLALKAFYLLKKNHPEIKFEYNIVGGGDPTFIQNLIFKYDLQKEVKILGRVESGKGVFQLLDRVDLYIHPSRSEGLPRSVIEAMSRACPILASTAGGTKELIESQYLHRPGDVKKLYNDLIKVLSHLDQRLIMASANFEKSRKFERKILAQRRAEFYTKSFEAIDKFYLSS